MIVAGIALACTAVCVAAWLLLFPEAGDAFVAACRRILRAIGGAARGAGRRVAGGVGDAGRRVQSGGTSAADGLLRHRWILLAAVVLVCAPSLLILWSRQRVVFEGFHGQDMAESRTMIAQLLRGERLVPPPAPPPAVFRTREVLRLKPEIVTADRKWARLDPDLQQRVLAIYQVMRERHGIEMVLVEGYRSPERQAELRRGGRATNAGAWASCHQYGLALDSAPLRDGKLQWNMSDPSTRDAYFLYGRLAQQAGLEWGGNWPSLRDYVHVELKDRCVQAKRERRARLAGDRG
ncbi:M15 family metallopeptidase [Luteimonas lutimaris]|uniref:M15 family metallopeptidase n=1 Tax=Luteimonas lutimaris TaxID=698645 RepID=A0ABP7MVP8_9GAMM